MNKIELADYLVNLHTLLEGQERTGLQKSNVLGKEYQKHWDLLKQEIANETRDDKDNDGGDEGRAEVGSDQSSLRRNPGSVAVPRVKERGDD